jgi:Na+-translocating ferredoxin:NAD+ oxidoreductase RnfG subunit
MIALVALGVFAAIGALLVAAVMLETRSQKRRQESPRLMRPL